MIATRTEAEEALFRAGLAGDDPAAVWRRGHFAFRSGDHGDARLDLEGVLADPQRLHRAAGALAQKLRAHAIDVVCSPAERGARVAQAVAGVLDRPFVAPDAWTILAGVRAAVVTDAVNTGAVALGAVRELRSLGATVAAVGVLVARAPAVLPVGAFDGVPVERLATVDWSLWPAASCPLCAAGVPLGDPS
jgi:orotate phosphoribosyltransferase